MKCCFLNTLLLLFIIVIRDDVNIDFFKAKGERIRSYVQKIDPNHEGKTGHYSLWFQPYLVAFSGIQLILKEFSFIVTEKFVFSIEGEENVQ